MKIKLISVLFIAILMIGLSSTNSYAAKSSYSQSITVNPLGLAFGLLNATYEQQLSATNSFTINGYYWGITDWVGYGLGGSYRWYIDLFKTRQKPLQGFSVGPRISFSTWSWEGFADSYDSGLTVNVGGEAMYKWVWDGFALELGLTLDFNVVKVDGLSYSPFGLVGGIGYAW